MPSSSTDTICRYTVWHQIVRILGLKRTVIIALKRRCLHHLYVTWNRPHVSSKCEALVCLLALTHHRGQRSLVEKCTFCSRITKNSQLRFYQDLFWIFAQEFVTSWSTDCQFAFDSWLGWTKNHFICLAHSLLRIVLILVSRGLKFIKNIVTREKRIHSW